jgi:putative ABC transport system permease protein
MKLLQSFRMSLKALGSKKGRSFLTMLGIIIGVAAVIAQFSVQSARNEQQLAFMRSMGENRVDVYINSWSYPNLLDEVYDFTKRELSGLSVGMTPSMQYYSNFRITYGAKTVDQTPLWFGSDQFTLCYGDTIDSGRDIAYMDVERNNRVVLIGPYVQKQLFGYRDPVGEHILISGEKFQVIGVLHTKLEGQTPPEDWPDWEMYSDDNRVVLPHGHMRLLTPGTTMNQLLVKAKDAESTQTIVDRLNNRFQPLMREQWDFQASSMTSYIEDIEAEQEKSSMTLVSIAAISLIVGGIGIMNIMLVTVTERTREIGIRKAIGAPRRSIIAQFLIEACVLTFVGGLLGLAAGFGYTLFSAKIVENMTVFPEPGICVIALGVTVVLGVGFGIYPAIKASALQPVAALRNE